MGLSLEEKYDIMSFCYLPPLTADTRALIFDRCNSCMDHPDNETFHYELNDVIDNLDFGALPDNDVEILNDLKNGSIDYIEIKK